MQFGGDPGAATATVDAPTTPAEIAANAATATSLRTIPDPPSSVPRRSMRPDADGDKQKRLRMTIVDGIDLPGIIRDSTGSLASEAVQGVRVQGQHADDAVGQLVGRVFRRRAALDGNST